LWSRLHADKGQIESTLVATKAESQAAERDLVAATEAGDAAKAAAAQRIIARSEAAIVQLEQGVQGVDGQIAEAKRLFEEHEARRARGEPKKAEAAPPPARQPTPDEGIDTTARPALGDAGAQWLKDNRQFVTDAKENRRLLLFADLYATEHGAGALKSKDFVQ